MESANGDLVKRWATLPLLVTKPAFLRRRTTFLPGQRWHGLRSRRVSFIYERWQQSRGRCCGNAGR